MPARSPFADAILPRAFADSVGPTYSAFADGAMPARKASADGVESLCSGLRGRCSPAHRASRTMLGRPTQPSGRIGLARQPSWAAQYRPPSLRGLGSTGRSAFAHSAGSPANLGGLRRTDPLKPSRSALDWPDQPSQAGLPPAPSSSLDDLDPAPRPNSPRPVDNHGHHRTTHATHVRHRHPARRHHDRGTPLISRLVDLGGGGDRVWAVCG